MASDRRGWGVVAGVTVVVLLLDALRVFLPSIIFVFGRAGSTAATTMGLFAAGWFVAGFLALPVARLAGARRLAIGAASGLLVVRLALLATDGGDPQLYLAGVTFVLAIWTLVGLADSAADRWPALGAVLGLPAAVLLHVGMGTVDPQWQDGAAGWLIAGLLGAALLVGIVLSPADNPTGEEDRPAPAAFWWRLGPALLLVGVVTATPAWTAVATADGRERLGTPMVVLFQLVAVAAVLWFDTGTERVTPVPGARRRSLMAAAVTGVLLALLAATLWGAGAAFAASAVSGLFIPVLLFAHITPGTADRRRPGLGAATGGLLMGLVGFLYYAGFDISLGDNRMLLLAAGILLWPRPSRPAARGPLAGTHPPTGRQQAVGAAALVAGLVVGTLLTPVSPAAPVPAATTSVRVAVANIHMGWDTSGRFAIDHIADDLSELEADIVVLNEVDRGWLLTGGHDTLRLLSDRLEMPYVFAPAADPLWGNAILSRFPLLSVDVAELPRGGVPMRRSVVTARVTLGNRALIVVGTHLHHVEGDDAVRAEQAAAVAEIVREPVGAGLPTVLLGDLNATPGDPALSSLADLLDDAVAGADPLPTFPSWDPDERIDHVLASPGLAVSDVVRGGSPDSSDHLWLAVTITLP